MWGVSGPSIAGVLVIGIFYIYPPLSFMSPPFTLLSFVRFSSLRCVE